MHMLSASAESVGRPDRLPMDHALRARYDPLSGAGSGDQMAQQHDETWREKRRVQLVERLRRVAAEEEATGADTVAADFRRRADAIEAGRDPR